MSAAFLRCLRTILLSLLAAAALTPARSQIPQKPLVLTRMPSCYQITVQGVAGRTYFYQYSPDLISWHYLPYMDVSLSGGQLIVQCSISASARNYFRLKYTDTNSADLDNDGLSNQYEVENSRTDPFQSDSDGDGMPDGWEVTNALNPNNALDAMADGDNDTVSNLREYQLGLNPANAFTYNNGTRDIDPATLDNPAQDSDGDGLINALDAVPWNRLLHFRRVPDTGYALIALGNGRVRAVNNRNEAVLVTRDTTVPLPAGNLLQRFYLWKAGTLRECQLPPPPSNSTVRRHAFVDFDHKGRLLIERTYTPAGWNQERTQLILFQDAANFSLPAQVLSVGSNLPPGTLPNPNPQHSAYIQDSGVFHLPSLMNDGKIFRLSVEYDSSTGTMVDGAVFTPYGATGYLSRTAPNDGFPKSYVRNTASAYPSLYQFLAITRDGWGVASRLTENGLYPVLAQPVPLPGTGTAYNENSGFSFGQNFSSQLSYTNFHPLSIAPLNFADSNSWPVMTEEAPANDSGSIGWTWSPSPAGPHTNGWERFVFRGRPVAPTTANPAPTPEQRKGPAQNLRQGEWNDRGEFACFDKYLGWGLWRNGTFKSVASLISPAPLPDTTLYNTGLPLINGINKSGLIGVSFTKKNNSSDHGGFLLVPIELKAFKRGTLNTPGPEVPSGTGQFGYETVMMENADSESSATSTSRDCDDSGASANLSTYRKANDDDLVKIILKWPVGIKPAGASLKLLHNGMQVDATQTTADAAVSTSGPSRLNFYKADGTRITNPTTDLQIADLANAPATSYLSKILTDGEVTIFIEGADGFGNLPANRITRLGGAQLKWEFTQGATTTNTKMLVYRGGFLRFLQPSGAPGTVGVFEFWDGKGRVRHTFGGFGKEFQTDDTDFGSRLASWTAKSGKAVNHPSTPGRSYNVPDGYGHTPPGWWKTTRRTDFTGTQPDQVTGTGPTKKIRQGGYVRWRQDDETAAANRYTTLYRYNAANAHDAAIGEPSAIRFKYDLDPIVFETAQGRTNIQIHPDGECTDPVMAGTAGCIGIQSYQACLEVDSILRGYHGLKVKVQLQN